MKVNLKIIKEKDLGLLYFPEGKKYEGEFTNNSVEGYGIKTYPDGKKYEGRFKNNNKDGYGII